MRLPGVWRGWPTNSVRVRGRRVVSSAASTGAAVAVSNSSRPVLGRPVSAGSVSAGLAIYDTMQYLRCDVATYTIGMAASMGALIQCGGTKGKRFILPNSRMLLHQPLIGGVMEGTASDLSIEAEEIIRLRKRLYAIISSRTGRPMATIEKDCDRNKWLDAEESVEYGLSDTILERMAEVP